MRGNATDFRNDHVALSDHKAIANPAAPDEHRNSREVAKKGHCNCRLCALLVHSGCSKILRFSPSGITDIDSKHAGVFLPGRDRGLPEAGEDPAVEAGREDGLCLSPVMKHSLSIRYQQADKAWPVIRLESRIWMRPRLSKRTSVNNTDVPCRSLKAVGASSHGEGR